LEATGAEVFSVENIGPSESWPAALEREMRTSDEMVVLLTNKSAQSQHVMFEMGLAAGLRIPVIVVEMGVKPELRSTLGILERVRYSNVDSYIQRLNKRIRSSNQERPLLNSKKHK
jgi:hypothetical protein